MAKLAALGGAPVASEGLKIRWPEFGDEERESPLAGASAGRMVAVWRARRAKRGGAV